MSMDSIWDFLRERTQPMQPRHAWQHWQPYISRYFMTRQMPRYYLSSVDMSTARGAYRWGVYQDCLLIVKWLSMGGIKIHLTMPPMSLSGDKQHELDVLRYLASNGISARLSDEDLMYFGRDSIATVPDSNGPEFVYRTKDYLALEGRKWHAWRKVQHNAKRLGWQVRCWVGDAVPRTVWDDIGRVTDEWAECQGKATNHAREVAIACRAVGHALNVAVAFDGTGRIGMWSAYHVLTQGKAVVLIGVWSDRVVFPNNEYAIYSHLLDVENMAADRLMGPESVFSTGGTRNQPGMIAAKRKVRPLVELGIHKVVTARQITKEEWKASRVNKTQVERTDMEPMFSC